MIRNSRPLAIHGRARFPLGQSTRLRRDHAPNDKPEAFSGEVGTGSREENASKQETGASVLIQSKRSVQGAMAIFEPVALQAITTRRAKHGEESS
jgi:hypothetical protein